MKITIIGTGMVGTTLAQRWLDAQHTVTFAARDLTSSRLVRARAATGDRARVGSVRDAVAGADVVVLATQYRDAKVALEEIGPLDGKVLIDVTNPIKPDLSGLFVHGDDSAAENIARWAPGARIVKAFNTMGFDVMANPAFPSGSACMILCGDDAEARKTVLGLARDIGFDAIDGGALEVARHLEPLAMLWIHLAHRQGLGRNIAFALLRR